MSATSAREIHWPVVSSKIASVYSIAVHRSSSIAAMAALTFGSSRTVTDTCAPPRIAAATVGCRRTRTARTRTLPAASGERNTRTVARVGDHSGDQ